MPVVAADRERAQRRRAPAVPVRANWRGAVTSPTVHGRGSAERPPLLLRAKRSTLASGEAE